jgi:hypothetical protein
MGETGLPALSEGYFWRVRHHRTRLYTYYGESYRTDTSRLQVLLIKTLSGTRTEKVYPKPWYRRTAREISTPYTSEDIQFVEDAEGTHVIAVRNAANRIMKRWEKAKVRDALVGDYPPKTLEVS